MFLEMEPAKLVEKPREMNLYAYVQGNPVSAVDRDGKATDFNIGYKPTYDQLPKWSELTPEQRMVEKVAMVLTGGAAASPIAAIGYGAAVSAVSVAYTTASIGVFGAVTNGVGVDNAYKAVTYAKQFVTGVTPGIPAEGKLGVGLSLVGMDKQIAEYQGTSPMKVFAGKVMGNPTYLMNPIGAIIDEYNLVDKGIDIMRSNFSSSERIE